MPEAVFTEIKLNVHFAVWIQAEHFGIPLRQFFICTNPFHCVPSKPYGWKQAGSVKHSRPVLYCPALILYNHMYHHLIFRMQPFVHDHPLHGKHQAADSLPAPRAFHPTIGRPHCLRIVSGCIHALASKPLSSLTLPCYSKLPSRQFRVTFRLEPPSSVCPRLGLERLLVPLLRPTGRFLYHGYAESPLMSGLTSIVLSRLCQVTRRSPSTAGSPGHS